MTAADRAAAQAAFNDGRGVYGRLDQLRGPEDAAADIMDLWAASESAMRAMIGGSTLSGQALVRELRQRGMLDLEQANALASFWDARTRVDDVGYKPTLTDIGYARSGYNELGRAITETPAPTATTDAAASPFAPPGARIGAAGAGSGSASGAKPAAGSACRAGDRAAPQSSTPVRRRPRLPLPVIIAAAVVLLAVIGGALYFAFGQSSYDRDMASAIALMQSGKNEAARAAFSSIARQHPDKADPHVFMSRLAREDGDLNSARDELVTAIKTDPGDERALREMGILLIAQNTQNSLNLARSFLVRAVQADTSDAAAQGYLGCALVKLNRSAEAQPFLARAGTGSWSSCSATPPPAASPQVAGQAPLSH